MLGRVQRGISATKTPSNRGLKRLGHVCSDGRLLFRAEFLRAPRHYFRRKNGIVLINCERMRIEMSSLVEWWSIQYADDLTVAANFQNPTCNCVGHIDKMIPSDKEAKGMT